MAELGHSLDAASSIAAKASATSYTAGGSVTILGFIAQADWMQILGAITLIGTFLVNWYYKHKSYKLEVQRLEESKKDYDKKFKDELDRLHKLHSK